MGRVRKRLSAWGKKNLGNTALKDILAELHNGRGMSQQAIANMFDATLPAIRYWLKKHGMLHEDERRTFGSVIRSQGYRNIAEFFTDPDNVRKTMKQLAADTGFCTVTVSQWYGKFLREKRKGKK